MMADSQDSPLPSAASSRGKYLTAPQRISGMPPGIPYIVGNEAAERFSYYGIIAVIAIFLTRQFRDAAGNLAPMDEHLAREWQHYFMAACYFFPIIGAVISDWLLGKYRTIIAVQLLYCVGHAVLALMDYPLVTGIDPKVLLFIGLALIAVGAGGIKPCVSAHVGDQFGQQNKHLMSKAFGWFYFSINFGSTISMPLTPWLLNKFGPGWAFGVPGVAMAIAAITFWLGRYKFVHIPPGGRNFLREAFDRDSLRAIAHLIPLFCFLVPFWALYDQSFSTWVYQARHMNLGGFDPETFSAQLEVTNAILIMIFIPLFTYVLYPLVDRYVTVTPLRKIGTGLFMATISFAIPSLIQTWIDAGEKPHIAWQLLAYVFLTAGEVLVWVTGLEFSYTQAPKKLKSIVMGVAFLSITLGDVFTAKVNGYIANQKLQGIAVLEGAHYYWFFTILMLCTALIFVGWSPFYQGRIYIQGETA
ncbi:MAG TPA: POT family MFS transporter [Lacipirellulaceae bacterium]|jgi:POT family proton-dependent oligopeptide transporter